MNALLVSHASFGASTGVSMNASRGSAAPAALPLRSSAPAGTSAGGGLALTRRGRLVLFGIPAIVAAALVLFLTLAVLTGSLASPAHASSEQQAVSMADYAVAVTVLQGDSLWSIAAAADSTRDVRHVVREIIALNDLGTGVLQAGQRLYIPVPK